MFGKIVRQDEREEFRDLIISAQKKFPDDIENQIKYVEENGSKQDILLGKLTILQYAYALSKKNKIELSSKEIELMLRAFLDAARHMQNKLPDGVYGYINNKSDSFMNDILKQVK